METFDLGASGHSFQFLEPGDSVTGTIVGMTELQQTDMKTGEPKTFTNGQPMMMYRFELQTDSGDPLDSEDDGIRSV